MGIDELCERFGVTRNTVHSWRKRGVIPPPYGFGKGAWYGRQHVEAIEAHRALQHNNVHTTDALAFCREAGITLSQYIKTREEAIQTFGIGVA
jgi:DNA-binding transcriptional MerR regulator